MMNARPREGDIAPDFTLQGPEGPFTLSEHRGETVVLLFYPGDRTPVCTKQFCSYRDRSEELEALDAVVVGISGQDVESKQDFIERYELTVPLLADPAGEIAKAYGVSGAMGTRRATFVIDPEGVVHAAKVHAFGLRFEDVDDLAEMIDGVRA
jgi:peroxiredoxin Q/BCP